jgi:capsular polysaccharide transport system permease protein
MATMQNNKIKINWSFIISVLIPTALAILYFGFTASDVYISESTFVVRSPQKQSSSSILGAFMQNAGFSTSQGDTNSVHSYILSRDAMYKLDKALNIKKLYESKNIDFINQFPHFFQKNSYEHFYNYYQDKISIEADPKTGISVLQVRAYDAVSAKKINALLLKMSEDLINSLNQRGSNDLVNYAESRVKQAELEARNTALALSSYRGKNSVFDPEAQSALQLQQIARLQDELINVNAQISQVLTFTPDSPQLPALKNRATGLKKEIAAESSKVTSGNESSLSSKAANYERLILERTFADQKLAGALVELEASRTEAQRQQLYLERLSQPSLPDMATEPERLRAIIATFILGLIVFGIFNLFIASVKEHQS